MKQKLLFTVCLILVVIVWMDCRPKDPGNKPSGAVPQKAAEEVGLVDPIDQAGLTKLIGQRNGKILFVNIWATWCAPCVEEFPDLVKLARACKDSGVEVVGISADYPDEVESKILPFLRKQNVPFRTYVAKFKRQEDFINSVDPKWSGALPATLIVDTTGKRRIFRVGAGSFEIFKSMIDSARMRPKGPS
ncbi:MAG: TlpA disulfide reductase family protein [Ignavibacteriales bacterium]|nr:TlpA disulfide reductase family protein [Ignavibacteriales bacterium]